VIRTDCFSARLPLEERLCAGVERYPQQGFLVQQILNSYPRPATSGISPCRT
jgi:hypothetical protein